MHRIRPGSALPLGVSCVPAEAQCNSKPWQIDNHVAGQPGAMQMEGILAACTGVSATTMDVQTSVVLVASQARQAAPQWTELGYLVEPGFAAKMR